MHVVNQCTQQCVTGSTRPRLISREEVTLSETLADSNPEAGPGQVGTPHPAVDQTAQWLLAAGAGDQAAFRQLYDATSPRLLGIALLLLRRRDAAEDVLQDAFVSIWRQADRYDPERGAPGPWMSQIVRNTAIDRLRKERMVHDDIADHHDDLVAEPALLEERFDVVRGLAAILPKQRQALLLAYQHGYSAQQIAVRLQTPLGTVKSRIRRGLDGLRSALQQDNGLIR